MMRTFYIVYVLLQMARQKQRLHLPIEFSL